jgi:hypothetical protein
MGQASIKQLTGWQPKSQVPSIKAAACRDADMRGAKIVQDLDD